MTLHEAILSVLQKYGPMSSSDIADKIKQANLYRRQDGGYAPAGQIAARINKYPHLFIRQDSLVQIKGAIRKLPPVCRAPKQKRDEDYIIDLCDEILNCKASRQHRFDFLLGDPNTQGKCSRLPVDAYYETLNLVIEYRERQHTESVPIMDRRPTVSSVDRGEQRRIYDKRREKILPEHGIKLIILSFNEFRYDSRKRLLRDPDSDKDIIRTKLKKQINHYL